MNDFRFLIWDKMHQMLCQVVEFHFEPEGDSHKLRVIGIEPAPDSVVYVRPEDAVILPYIGMKDKSGKDIHEGHILRTNEAGWVAKVIYNGAAFMLTDNKGGWSAEPEWSQCEVIGNIYQTPELLEGEKEIVP